MQRILFVGATGRLGRPVAIALARWGFSVRALVRDMARGKSLSAAGIELCEGDVTQPQTLVSAMAGCEGVYISLRGTNTVASYEANEVQGVENLVNAAANAELQRVIYLSGAGRTVGNERYFPVRVKQACENTLRQGGVPFTILRATHFMESLPMFIRGNTAEILGRQPHRYHYLAAEDYARMLSGALRSEHAANKVLTLLGPQPYTMREALEIYLARIHPGMKIKTLPLPLLRLIAGIKKDDDLRFAVSLFEAFAALGEEGDPAEANALLPAPRITLDQWIDSQTSRAIA